MRVRYSVQFYYKEEQDTERTEGAVGWREMISEGGKSCVRVCVFGVYISAMLCKEGVKLWVILKFP